MSEFKRVSQGVYIRRIRDDKIPYIRYKINGKTRYESLGKNATIKQAIILYAERTKQIEKGIINRCRLRIPTLNEIQNEFIEVKISEEKNSWTRDVTSLKHLTKCFGNYNLDKIKSSHVRRYKTNRANKVSKKTVNNELSTLRRIINWYQEEYEIDFENKNPVSKVGLFKVDNFLNRVLSYEEEIKLLEVSPQFLKNILIFALNTGCRKNEILTLTWDIVDFKNNFITIKSKNSKSKKSRNIYMNGTVRDLLNELRMFSRISDYVFLSSKGTPYKRQDSLNRVYNNCLKKAGITGVNFHTLRHSFGTRLYEKSKDLVAVSKLMGHSSIELTKSRYVHNENTLQNAINMLDSDKSVTQGVTVNSF